MKKILIATLLSFSFCVGFSQRNYLGEHFEKIPEKVLHVNPPLYMPDDTTIAVDVLNYWVQTAANTIKHDSGTVTINNDTAAALANGSPALILKNNKAATSGNPQFTPALSLQGTTYNTIGGGSQVPVEWRIFASTQSVGGVGVSTLYFVPIINGVPAAAPITMGSSGSSTFNAMSGNTVTAATFTGTDLVLGRKIVGTYSISNGVTSDAAWLDISPTSNYTLTTGYRTFRGIYYHPSIVTTMSAGMVAYENTYGENRNNSFGGRTGVGVPDSVDKSAKFEVRSTTMGLLPPRMTKAQRNAIISSLKGTISGGIGYTNATRANIALTGGSGSGATADLVITGNAVTTVSIRDIGSGYVVGDVLSATIPGGGSGFTYTITEANPPADGLLVEVTGETGGTYISQYNSSTSGWVKLSSTAD